MSDLVEELNDCLVRGLDMERDWGKGEDWVVERKEVRSDWLGLVVWGRNGVKKVCEGLIMVIEIGFVFGSECESFNIVLSVIVLSVMGMCRVKKIKKNVYELYCIG